ncbi:MAG: ECF transporter S component [Roseburia sp.]|nr:ECF transporter S component [Roseburia sp.]
MSGFMKSVADNLVFVMEFLAVIVALFLVALLLEKLNQKRQGKKQKLFDTRRIVVIGMFSALAAVLMVIELPVFFAPPFYGLDFSELPILVGTFAFGPVAGVMMEFLKILLKLLFKPTSTAFVGELANFAVGCSFILPASAIYLFRKTKKGAIAGCVVGTLVMTVFGTAFNAIYLLPAFARMFMPMEAILAAGAEVNPLMKEGSIISFVIVCVAPLNLMKGAADSLVTLLVYKPLSPILKAGHKM